MLKTNRRSLWLLLLIGALLIGGAAGFLYFTYRPSVGSGPAGPVVDRQQFTRIWTTNKVLVVGLGDSVTAGFGARKGYGYFDRLLANPPDEFPEMSGVNLRAVMPNLAATNLSISGSTSGEVPHSQLLRLPQAESNVLGIVVITTGGNDLIHNYGRTAPREQAMYGATMAEGLPWVAEFEKRLELIVQEIDARFPGGCHIFFCNIYDPSDGAGDIEKSGLPAWPDGLKLLARYNEAIENCARKHPSVHLVDMHRLFLGHGLHSGQFWFRHYDRKDPHYWYYTNLEDPNERGYDALRRLFLNEISSVLPVQFGPGDTLDRSIGRNAPR
jgi:lysophospholipase L1-like esterase